MIWLPIPKKDPETSKPLTRYNAIKRALSSTDLAIWHNDETTLERKIKRFPQLKAAVYEENYKAFTVADRGRFWYVILK
jgi:hypothetical protein